MGEVYSCYGYGPSVIGGEAEQRTQTLSNGLNQGTYITILSISLLHKEAHSDFQQHTSVLKRRF